MRKRFFAESWFRLLLRRFPLWFATIQYASFWRASSLELSQFDIKTAFINGILSNEIYMQLPALIQEMTKWKLNKIYIYIWPK